MKTHLTLRINRIIILLGFMLLFNEGSHGAESESKQNLNGGFYLLHKLCEDEAQVPLLLDVKHTTQNIKDLADQISQRAKQTNFQLEQMQAKDPSIRWDENPLPPIEQWARKSIEEEKQQELLLGKSNEAFNQAFLISQIEATNYATNLAKVLADRENNEDDANILQQISKNWLFLHQKSFRLLAKTP